MYSSALLTAGYKQISGKLRISAIGRDKKHKDILICSSNEVDVTIYSIYYDEYMIEGRCPKCGFVVFGWSLRFSRNQTCPKCGTSLDINEDGENITGGYSPFSAETHSITQPGTPVYPSDPKDEGPNS